MTEQEPQSFIDYWDEVDDALLKLWGADSLTLGIDAEEISIAQDNGETPREFAQWFGEKYDLTPVDEWWKEIELIRQIVT